MTLRIESAVKYSTVSPYYIYYPFTETLESECKAMDTGEGRIVKVAGLTYMFLNSLEN